MLSFLVTIIILYIVVAATATSFMDHGEISRVSFGRRVVKQTSADGETWYELQQMTPLFYWVKVKPFFSRASKTGKFTTEAEPAKYLDYYNKKVKKSSKTEVVKK